MAQHMLSMCTEMFSEMKNAFLIKLAVDQYVEETTCHRGSFALMQFSQHYLRVVKIQAVISCNHEN